MNLSGAQVIAEWLGREGVEAVFVVPGRQIDPLFGHLAQCRHVNTIVANHELAAGFMADGYARASYGLGVCIGIGAAGASNMLTAALTARSDDSAVLFLSGNVPWSLRGQGAFQDAWASGTNDVAVFRKMVVHSDAVRNAAALQERLGFLTEAMRHPHRTPAHLCVPHDVLQAMAAEPTKADAIAFAQSGREVLQGLKGSGVLARLASARRPILLAGSRAVAAGAANHLREFAEIYNVPIASTLSAKGIMEEGHPLCLGNFGYGGSRRANEALLHSDADLLLLLGGEWTERDSLCWDGRLHPANRIVLRIDPKRMSHRHALPPDGEAHVECREALRCMLDLHGTQLRGLRESAAGREPWLNLLRAIPRIDEPSDALPATGEGMSLDRLVTELRRLLPDDAILVVDAGLHRVFAGHYWSCRTPGTFFTASTVAPMGWAIAAALGIQLARPGQPVVVLTGDGCMLAHGNELATMARYDLPIIVVVCRNGVYGSIRQHFAANAPAAARTSLPAVDWTAYATALGARGIEVGEMHRLRGALETALAVGGNGQRRKGKPTLVEVPTPIDQPLPGPDVVCSALVRAAKSVTETLVRAQPSCPSAPGAKVTEE